MTAALIISTWILSVVCAFWLGHHLRGIAKKIEQVEASVKMKVDKKSEPEEPKSQLIDPADEIQQAMWEREQLMKKMNPND